MSIRSGWLLGSLAAFGIAWLGCSNTPVDSAGSSGAAGSAGASGGGGLSASAGSSLGGAGGTTSATAGSGGVTQPTGGAGGASGAGGSGGEPAPLFDWNYFGRWNLADPAQAITVNSGSHVTASFNGTGISASFDISGNNAVRPTVTWKIDQGEWMESEIDAALSLATGLPLAEHTLLLLVRGMSEVNERWTPPLVSSVVFKGLSVTGGSIVPTARPVRKKIEFLGDSITEGVALHGQGPAGQVTPNWRTDGPRAYPALTAMALSAEWRQVGFGRLGLTVTGNGGVPKAADAFNWIYAGVPRDAWQPDMVVVNQGTNDGGASGQVFAPLYGSYLGLIRTAYPDAKIVALRPFNGAFGSEIEAQVTLKNAGGDAKIFYVSTEGWTSPGDFTDGLHPNVSGSVTIRDKLTPVLQGLL